MQAVYIPANAIKELEFQLKSIAQQTSSKSLLFLMAEQSVDQFEAILPKISKGGFKIIGGIFPSLIVEGKRTDEGLLLMVLPFELNIQRIDLNQSRSGIMDDLSDKQQHSLAPQSTLFVFFDALSPNKGVFTESLFNYFGINATYIGGGAGSLSFESSPVVIDNEGIHQDCAIIGWTNSAIDLGYAHGWKPISEPLKITKAKNNLVHSLDWEPAFKIYQTVIEEHSGEKITEENFFEIAKSYPFGITKMDAEMVVRDPFKADEKGIQFFDSIQEGEYVKILHGNIESLLEGAVQAKKIASKNKLNDCGCLCIDCISRALFLGDLFEKEMDVIECSAALNGALTIGEIANSGESYLEIFNKTIVLGLW